MIPVTTDGTSHIFYVAGENLTAFSGLVFLGEAFSILYHCDIPCSLAGQYFPLTTGTQIANLIRT